LKIINIFLGDILFIFLVTVDSILDVTVVT